MDCGLARSRIAAISFGLLVACNVRCTQKSDPDEVPSACGIPYASPTDYPIHDDDLTIDAFSALPSAFAPALGELAIRVSGTIGDDLGTSSASSALVSGDSSDADDDDSSDADDDDSSDADDDDSSGDDDDSSDGDDDDRSDGDDDASSDDDGEDEDEEFDLVPGTFRRLGPRAV